MSANVPLMYTTRGVVSMSDRVQIGPQVDRELWEEFREDVKRRHGQTRGVLGKELENAIRDYIHYGTDRTIYQQFEEFNERLQRVEGAVGAAESDGGATPSERADTHTHHPPGEITERPDPRGARDKKIAYLTHRVRVEELGPEAAARGESPDMLLQSSVVDVVKDEYSFRRDTAREHVEGVIDRLGLREHPRNGDLYVSDKKYEQVKQSPEPVDET